MSQCVPGVSSVLVTAVHDILKTGGLNTGQSVCVILISAWIVRHAHRFSTVHWTTLASYACS